MKINILSVILLLMLGGVVTFFLTRPKEVGPSTERIVYIDRQISDNKAEISNISATNSILFERKQSIEEQLLTVLTGGPLNGFLSYTNAVNDIDRGRVKTISLYETNESLHEQKAAALEGTIRNLNAKAKADKAILYTACFVGAVGLTALGITALKK